jgi:hypothetical protein
MTATHANLCACKSAIADADRCFGATGQKLEGAASSGCSHWSGCRLLNRFFGLNPPVASTAARMLPLNQTDALNPERTSVPRARYPRGLRVWIVFSRSRYLVSLEGEGGSSSISGLCPLRLSRVDNSRVSSRILSASRSKNDRQNSEWRCHVLCTIRLIYFELQASFWRLLACSSHA